MDGIRILLRDGRFLGRIPYLLETPRYYARCRPSRSRAHSRIYALENERERLEIDCLKRMIELDDDEWERERSALVDAYKLKRSGIERKIRKIVKRSSESIKKQFDQGRQRMRKLLKRFQAGKRSKRRPVEKPLPRKRRSRGAVDPGGVLEGSMQTDGHFTRSRARARVVAEPIGIADDDGEVDDG